MHSRLSFLLTTLLIVVTAPSVTLSQSTATDHSLTLQVGSFPSSELTDRFAAQLVIAGEQPRRVTVELPGRGYWTRVFLGSFVTSDEAHKYGARLVARGLIKEFLVKRADANREATRPRRVIPFNARSSAQPVADLPAGKSPLRDKRSTALRPTGAGKLAAADRARAFGAPGPESKSLSQSLPVLKTRSVEIAPCFEIDSIPRPDPVSLALRLVVGGAAGLNSTERGGLWITGDASEGLARLRWIVGDENARLIRLDGDGRVRLERDLLARAAGLTAARVEDPVSVANYITSNEGLLLIAQITQGRYRYRLHVGRSAPTYGKTVEISSSVNLDHNFDSRINPYRSHGKKLDHELPPRGFDSLVALNPVARWYNLSTRSWVPLGEVAFHELAEAYAKLALGLDYLAQGARAGAHALALEREHLLKAQRPDEDIVMTAGSNRVLRNEEEIRLFFADNPGRVSQR